MQSRIPLPILDIQIRIPCKQIRNSHLTLAIASPMQRCAASLILLININPTLFENIQGWRGISLRSNMHHSQPIGIYNMAVGFIINQGFNRVDITLEGGIMQCGPSLPRCLFVDPAFNNILWDLLLVTSKIY